MCFNPSIAKYFDPGGALVQGLQDKALGPNNPLDAFSGLAGTSKAFQNYKDNQKPDAPINYSGTPASSTSSRDTTVDPTTGLPVPTTAQRSLSIPTQASSSSMPLTSNPGLNIPT